MNFIEATKAAVKGYDVRNSWLKEKGHYVTHSAAAPACLVLVYNSGEGSGSYVPSVDDITSDDWEIVVYERQLLEFMLKRIGVTKEQAKQLLLEELKIGK